MAEPDKARRNAGCAPMWLLLPGLLFGSCVGWEIILSRRATPPRDLATLNDFLAWKTNRILGRGTFEHSGTNYLVLLGPAGNGVPSGPAAYLFDTNGTFIDWTSDMGDVMTSKHRFDLSGGALKNVERKRKQRSAQ